MNNNYETAEAFEIDRAQNSIRGMKVQDPFFCDDPLGCGWRFIDSDIDESDE